LVLALREERRLRVFESRMLRRIFGPKRDEVTGSGENYITRSLMVFTVYHILFGSSMKEDVMIVILLCFHCHPVQFMVNLNTAGTVRYIELLSSCS